jgi:hypothetical protein
MVTRALTIRASNGDRIYPAKAATPQIFFAD